MTNNVQTLPTGDFPNARPCPDCGHCPTCGRSNQRAYPQPYISPWFVPDWTYRPGTITYTSGYVKAG